MSAQHNWKKYDGSLLTIIRMTVGVYKRAWIYREETKWIRGRWKTCTHVSDNSFWFRQKNWKQFLVAMRLRGTPVPIPNTMVKTQAADGTLLETVRESRWPPELKKKNWFYQWLEIWKKEVPKQSFGTTFALDSKRPRQVFRFLMTDKTSVEKMRSSKTDGLIAHGITCQCIKKQLCLGKQAFHT